MNRAMLLLLFTSMLGTRVAALPSSEEPLVDVSRTEQHLVWDREPIRITLPVGEERLISFPEEVTFGYDAQVLPAFVLRVENDHQTLYLLAKKPFPTERVEAKLSNGVIILIDLNAKIRANDNPIDIVLPKLRDEFFPTETTPNNTKLNDVVLMRYAIQQLYAPERLLKEASNIARFPMETTHVVRLFYDNSATAMPLASWRGEDLYVTALLVKNLLNQPLSLNPKYLCGNWKAASFYPHPVLAAHGTPFNQDTTTLFLISARPFSEAIRTCLIGKE